METVGGNHLAYPSPRFCVSADSKRLGHLHKCFRMNSCERGSEVRILKELAEVGGRQIEVKEKSSWRVGRLRIKNIVTIK
jgi:hypothetical protein